MESNQYKILSKDINGITIKGFTIENSEGNIKNISLADAIKLARSNKISNASAKFDMINSEYKLSVENGLLQLPYSDRTRGMKFTLLGRIVNSSNKCIGYKVQDDKGKLYKLSALKIWELAEQGSVYGIEAKLSTKGKLLISSDECKLETLPVFKS